MNDTKRAVPVVEIGYRSAGAFLVAYVSQISRGELFVESPTLPPRGTPLVLRIAAPPATMTLEGMVVGTREARPGQPPGMSVALGPPSEEFGQTVDRLAAAFAGFRVLLSTGEAAPRAILGRYLRSILTCTVLDVDQQDAPLGGREGGREVHGRRGLTHAAFLVRDRDDSSHGASRPS